MYFIDVKVTRHRPKANRKSVGVNFNARTSSNLDHVILSVQSFTFFVGALFLSFYFLHCGQETIYEFDFWRLASCFILLVSCFLLWKPIDRSLVSNLLWAQRKDVQPQRCTPVSFAFWRQTEERDTKFCPAKCMTLTALSWTPNCNHRFRSLHRTRTCVWVECTCVAFNFQWPS